jgi:drug/metabolite transporter (DMT)-like permease
VSAGGIPATVKPSRSFLTPIDVLLLLMILIWGSNYSVVKMALRQIPPLPFNSLRLALASLLFLGSLAVAGGRRGPATTAPRQGWRAFPSARTLSGRDWLLIAALGALGHFVYQMCFMGGVARTSVSNVSLILGTSPVAVAMLSSAVGHEQVNRRHWIGAVLSVGGVYLVAGRDASLSGQTMVGDLLAVCAVLCWTVYTVAARSLLERHPPLVVTGYTMAIGTVLYVPFGLAGLRALDWHSVSPGAWTGLVFSAVFALYVAYLVWHTAVQRIGNLRTSIYSNMLPALAMLIAAIWLNEEITAPKVAGAAAILIGVGITRTAPAPSAPPEE